jgi:Rhodopirellula transposase DDE domain
VHKTEAAISKRFRSVAAFLDERTRRLIAAAESQALGYGGDSVVNRATGVSRRALSVGRKELQQPSAGRLEGRVRRAGGGRKRAVSKDPSLKQALAALVEESTRGDPMSPLLWTCKSVRRLAEELTRGGHPVSYPLVATLLLELGYSLQANVKRHEGEDHPDRNAQFEYLNGQVREYLAAGEPVISVDTKKKELVGDFKNSGREWRLKGEPLAVRVHDFVIPELGRVSPYGIYDLQHNTGWVNVGTDHDTSAFAVASIRRWWHSMGQAAYPRAQRWLITADGGGSNGSRVRLWKLELQKLANELGLPIQVCHLPPGTSKWNKIEHRLFSFISQNWRAKPLTSHEVVVNLIAATTNRKGLKVACALDTAKYPAGVKVSDEEMEKLNLKRHDFHGEWNYTLHPNWPQKL